MKAGFVHYASDSDVSASAVLNRKAGYVIAIFSSILYGVMIDLQYYKLLPIKYDPALNEKNFLYNIKLSL